MKYRITRKRRADGNRIGMPTPKVMVTKTTLVMEEYL